MLKCSRRGFLIAAAGALAPVLRAGPAADTGLIEVDLDAQQKWIEVGGTTGYLYGFNGQIPGPTIEARPGDHVRIRFTNSLPEPTNLHYHGLHVAYSGEADHYSGMMPISNPGDADHHRSEATLASFIIVK